LIPLIPVCLSEKPTANQWGSSQEVDFPSEVTVYVRIATPATAQVTHETAPRRRARACVCFGGLRASVRADRQHGSKRSDAGLEVSKEGLNPIGM